MQILPQYYTIPIVEIAALRPNMKAVFSPKLPLLAVSALSRVFHRLTGFLPVLAEYSTNKTAGALATVDVPSLCIQKTLLNIVFPRTPFVKSSDRCGIEATPEFLAIEKQHIVAGEVNYE